MRRLVTVPSEDGRGRRNEMIRGIPVAKLREILDDPANKIRDDDLVTVNQVGNLHFLDRNLCDSRMWIDFGSEALEGEGLPPNDEPEQP